MRELIELTDEELQQLDEADLRELATWADAEAARRKHEATGIRQFSTSPEYLGTGNVWAGVVDACEAIVEGRYNEAVLGWGVGSGKSVTGALLLCWECFKLLAQIASGEFWARYNLSGSKPIAMFVLASRQQQAESTIFREIRGRLDSSPWFEREYPTDKRLRSEIVFTKNGERLPLTIRVLPAREEAILAHDTWACVIDEASWLVASRGPMGDSASEIYDRIKSRMVSRFRGDGLLIVTSAPRHLQDFVQRRSREIEAGNEPKAYTSRRTTWEMVPAPSPRSKVGSALTCSIRRRAPS